MNAAENLAREIARVAVVRERLENVAARFPATNIEPAILMMSRSLDRAFYATGSNDAEEVIDAIKDLEGYGD